MNIVIAAVLLFFVNVAGAQTVTIDFTRARESSLGIPWTEDGFTVASLTQQSPLGGGLFVTAVSSGPMVGNPPPAGLLQFRAGGGVNPVPLVSAILTNDLQLSFNLLSVDFYSFTSSLSATDYARVYSSAGGSFDLLGTPSQTTLTFGGSAWENLSYVKVDLFSQGGFSSSQMLLDNFSVQVNAVPEPSSLYIVLLLIAGRLWKNSRFFPSCRHA